MTTPRRNDRCPCGSGKKYKKCHGAATILPVDYAYDRIRRLEGECSSLLLKFASQKYGEKGIEEAWQDFRIAGTVPPDRGGQKGDFFSRWLTFNWRPGREETLPELFLAKRGPKVESEIRRMIEATIRSPYSFFQTEDVEPGVSIMLRDVLRKLEFQVSERTASKMVQRGNILYAQVVELDGIAFLMGTGSVVMPASFLDTLLRLRSSLEKPGFLTAGHRLDEDLLEREDKLRELYFSLAESAEKRRPDMRNTDGDPLEFHNLTYSVSSFPAAFQALKGLEQNVTGRDDAELIEEAERATIHWLKSSRKGSPDATTVAALRLAGTTLIAEVNSAKRAGRIRREIAKRLGEEAVLMKTEIVPFEAAMKQAGAKAEQEEPGTESEHDRIMRESPEARAFMKEFNDRHWASWPDVPLPALRGKTPRQAAKDPIGRELLESLFLDFDSRNSRLEDESQRVDVAKLRQELGLGISRVVYRHGMIKSLSSLHGLKKQVFVGDDIPREVIAAIDENHLLKAGGKYGDREAGNPIEYDHLVIEHPKGRTEITFYNRGISLLLGDNETERRIHRVCTILQGLRPS